MKYVITIDKQVGTNSFNSQFINSTENETQAKMLVNELENAFDSFKLRTKTTKRSDGEFTFFNIELKRG